MKRFSTLILAGILSVLPGVRLLWAEPLNLTLSDNTSSSVESGDILAPQLSNACTFACDTAGNTAGGNSVLQNNTGINNTGFGDNALTNNTTGTVDSAFGFNALRNNTTGSGNTAAGAGALKFNTTGSHNSAFGTVALFHNTTGFENTASGKETLFNNTTGIQNTASGKLVADAQHAALAIAEGCTWITRDRDFARFALHGLSWNHLQL
ncbi:MAG: PIN domain-containing protein [Deltaproteobacteria bacterium]|nr:PIN domain-containing protein [Deltaproteobacteria bacterium]